MREFFRRPPSRFPSTMGSISELDRYVQRWARRYHVPGIGYALAERGRPLLAKGYGYRDVRSRSPVTAQTIFGIASMTKSVTAAAILRLQEQGRLRVTDPLVRHVPEFRGPDRRWTRRIQLHHLLTHSSGLPPLPTLWYSLSRSVFREWPFRPRVARRAGVDPTHAPVETVGELLEFLATARYRPVAPVGAQFSYSNEGFALLGAVIERITGRPFEVFIEEEILGPAQMANTSFDPGVLARQADRTTLYSPNFALRSKSHRPVASSEWWETTCFRAAGGLRSNVEDLLRYLEIFRTEGRVGSERILERRSVRTMVTPYIEAFPGEWYGYGLRVSGGTPGERIVSHEGGLKGVASAMAAHLGKGLTSVALSNQDEPGTRVLVSAGINSRLGRPLSAPFELPPRVRQDPPLSDFSGDYGCGEGWWARVRSARAGLRLDFDGIEITVKGLNLRRWGGDLFVASMAGQRRFVGFLRRPDGRVSALRVGWRVVRRRAPGEREKARTGRIVW